ncbi:MAG: sugar ABC transporter permease [Ruminococcaceae bacterium]|nr:sugar ABC transporter permease [Oscillospiraceae bacterium]
MNSEAKVKTTQVQTKKRRKSKSLDKKKAKMGWIFVLPFVLVFLLVYVPILIDSINYSFHEIVILPGGGFDLDFVGWDNYSYALFENPDFVQTLTTGIQQLVFDIPAIVIFSLFMAILLNQKMSGRTFFRAVFFVPVILSTGIISSIEQQNNAMVSDLMGDGMALEDMDEGASQGVEVISAMDVQALFANMKVGTELVDYVVSIVNNIYGIINRSGVQMLIFLAGLQSISPAIYESCTVEGATAWETFWKITFPMISPMILVNAVYTVIDAFTSSTNSVMTFISNVAAETNGDVRSSAMSWMYFLIVMLIISVVSAVMSAYVFYQRRD